MTIRERKLLFILAILLFIVISPVIILYALGYDFDFFTNKVIPTGGLYLNITPKGVKIFIDGKLEKENSPYTLGSGIFIKDKMEKIYNLEIKKDNYYDWKKEAVVKSSLVTEFKYVLLIKKNPELILTNFKNISEINNAEKIKKMEKILGVKIKNFSIEDDNIFFLNDKSKLYQFEEKNSQLKLIEENIISFSRDNQIIYFLDKEGGLFVKEINSEEKQKIAAFKIDSNNQEEIEMKTSAGLLTINYSGNLFLLNQENRQFEKIDENVSDFQFDQRGAKILYLKENHLKNFNLKEIWVYYLESRVQPLIEAKDKSLVYSTSTNIHSPFFAGPDHEQIIFVKENEGILITEIDIRGGQNIIKLADVKNPKIYYQKNTLYFEDKNKIFSVTIF